MALRKALVSMFCLIFEKSKYMEHNFSITDRISKNGPATGSITVDRATNWKSTIYQKVISASFKYIYQGFMKTNSQNLTMLHFFVCRGHISIMTEKNNIVSGCRVPGKDRSACILYVGALP